MRKSRDKPYNIFTISLQYGGYPVIDINNFVSLLQNTSPHAIYVSFVTEHEPSPQQPSEPTPERDMQAVAHPAHPEPVPVYSAAFGGEGKRHTFADHHTTLELYPGGTIFTYQAAESTITVRVSTTGEVVFARTPHAAPEATELPVPAGSAATQRNVQPTPEPAVSAPSTMPQEHQQQHRQATPEKQEQDENQKVILTGNVASMPTFKQTGKGLMAKFTLAEHPDVDKTEFHDVVAFGKRAEKLKDSLTKGEAVKVVGKPIAWQPETKKGKPPQPEQVILLWQLSRVANKAGE